VQFTVLVESLNSAYQQKIGSLLIVALTTLKPLSLPPSLSRIKIMFSGRKSPLQLNKENWYVPLQYSCSAAYALVSAD